MERNTTCVREAQEEKGRDGKMMCEKGEKLGRREEGGREV